MSSCLLRHERAAWTGAVCAALVLAAGLSPTRVEASQRPGKQAKPAKPAQTAVEPAAVAPQAPAGEAASAATPARPPAPELTGYVLESGLRLPIDSYAPYKTARLRWNAGFVTTWSSIALMGTGVGALLLGSQGRDGLTLQGQTQATVTGGVLTGLGAAGMTVGIVVWSLARRDLLRIERALPRPAAASPGLAARLVPSASVVPTAAGPAFSLSLSGILP